MQAAERVSNWVSLTVCSEGMTAGVRQAKIRPGDMKSSSNLRAI
jgi:hypothetical protein